MELRRGLALAEKSKSGVSAQLEAELRAKPDIYTNAMHFVYVLESADRKHWYFGVTNNVKRRLIEHNTGNSIYTSKHGPWTLRICVTFKNRVHAEEFERYLKSHSGRAFMSKHFSD